METKKVGWYVFLSGIVIGIVDYFGLLGYFGISHPTESFNLWILTPLSWSAIALIVVGALMIRLGRRSPAMPVMYR